MPCTVTYNGKEYSEAEFFAFLANGGLEQLIKEGVYEPKRDIGGIEPPKGGKTDTGKQPPKEKRKFTNQVLEEYPELTTMLDTDTIFYDKLPNAKSLEEANAMIDYLGMEEAKRAYMDFDNGMNGAVRTVVGMSLIKRYQSEGDYDSVIEVVEAMGKRGTDVGREIQAMSLFSALTPEGQLKLSEKIISKQREKRAERDKPKTTKAIKKLKEANKEAVNEALQSDKVSKIVTKVDKIQTKPNPKSPSYGAKNKLVTKAKYEQLKKEARGLLLSTIPPQIIEIGIYHMEAGARSFADFSSAMIDEFGKKIKPYLKESYKKGKKELLNNDYPEADFSTDQDIIMAENEEKGREIVKRIEVAMKAKNKKATEAAIAELQKLGKDTGLWGKYRKYAVSRLKNIGLGDIQKDIAQQPSLEDFTNGLVKNLQEKLKEQQPETERKKSITKPAIEIIADAYKNIEKYQDVWTDTMKEFRDKYKNDPEKLEALDAYYGEIMDKPFSTSMIGKAVKQELKALNISVADVIKQHYTVYDAASRSLVKSLVDKSGLTNEEATELANAVQAEFDRIATEKKRKALDKILSRKERAKPEVRGLEEDLIRLTNLGAFTDEAILKEWADKNGYPRLTPENVKEIQRLANRVQESIEGFQKFRAIEDLLTYQANLKGVDKMDVLIAVWYANILSGFTTQEVNFVANLINSALLYGNAVAQKPTNSAFIAQGFIDGFKRGLIEGKETFRTGYSPIRGKVEVPGVLERVNFSGWAKPLNYAKYVSRFMKAADVIVFEALKEMRAHQLAVKEAAKENKLEPTDSIRKRASELLSKTDEAYQEAQEQAQLEYEQEVDDINESSESKEQKSSRLKQAEIDRARRVYEIMDEQRDEKIQGKTADYAARGTFNYKPEGVLGFLSSVANQGKDAVNRIAEDANNPYAKTAANVVKLFVNSIVPFTNIIANTTNEALNYTPLGAIRAKGGQSSLTGYNAKQLDDQEKIDLYTKAIIGTTTMVAVYMLATLPFGDDDEPLIEVTANGYGDFKKNYELAETGWQPYSIRVGNTWVSYQYSPLIGALSLVGNIKDFERYRGEKLTDDGLGTMASVAVGSTTRLMLDQTFLSSLNTFLSAAMDQRNEDRVGDLQKSLVKSATTVVVPNLYTQTAKEVERAFGVDLKETNNTMFGATMQHVPFARNMYYDKINGLGETIPPDTDKFISFSTDERLWQLLASKRATVSQGSIRTQKIIDGQTKQKRLMTQKEYYIYSLKRGEYIKQWLDREYDRLNKLSPDMFKKQLTKTKKEAGVHAKGFLGDQEILDIE